MRLYKAEVDDCIRPSTADRRSLRDDVEASEETRRSARVSHIDGGDRYFFILEESALWKTAEVNG